MTRWDRYRAALCALLACSVATAGLSVTPAAAQPDSTRAAVRVTPPVAVSARADGTTVTLAWKRPVHVSERSIERYEARYRIDGDLTWSMVISTEDRSLRIHDLIGGKRTGLQVRAVTSRAEGLWSKTVTALPLSAPGAVESIRIATLDRAVEVAWSPPARSGGRTIEGYDVQYRITATGQWYQVARGTARATITGLKNAAQYSLRIRARNALGAGPWSAAVRAIPGTTAPTRRTGANAGLSTLSALPASPDSLAAPTSKAAVDAAEPVPSAPVPVPVDRLIAGAPSAPAAYSPAQVAEAAPEMPAAEAEPALLESDQPHALIPPVPAGTDGPSTPTPLETSSLTPVPSASETPTPPDDITGLTAKSASAAVLLSWAAATSGVAADHYEIRLRPLQSADWTILVGNDSTAQSIGGLVNGVDYEFAVRAVGASRGAWSDPVAMRPGTPSAPEAPSISFVDRKLALQASWTSDSVETNGSRITGWQLRYRSGSGDWTTKNEYDPAAAAMDIASLPGGFNYYFSLRAASDAGPGEWSANHRLYVPVLTLPLMTVHTAGSKSITSTESYVDAVYSLGRVADGVAEAPISGATQIRGRGNTTWGASKKPYRLKLAAKTELLGMPANKNWVLLANAFDHSLLRNDTALYMGTKTGLAWTPRVRYVELILNGDYVGLYQLAEQVRIDTNRININAMKTTDVSGNAVTGGYQLELDGRWTQAVGPGFVSSMNQPIAVVDPEVPVPQQLEYIKNYFNSFEAALRSPSRGDPQVGYSKFIDVQSFADWYIIEEYVKNGDANFASTDVYKPRGGVLTMGPLWDFDLSFGYSADHPEFQREWIVRRGVWWSELFKDDGWKQMVSDRWKVFRRCANDIDMHLEQTSALIATAAAGDQARWAYSDHDEQVRELSASLSERGSWLDLQWGTAG